MKILVIGGTRFIGPYVVKLLHAKGHEVILFHRGKTTYPFPFSIQHIQGNRTHLLSFKKQFTKLSLDVVIDMVAYSEIDAQQLIETLRRHVPHIVMLSSCDVYRAYDRLCNVLSDAPIPTPLTEEAQLRTHFYPYRKMATGVDDWRYHYEKILVENTVRACSEIHSTILRLPMIYGPGDYSRIYPYLKRMDDGRAILLDEKKACWRPCRGYVEDVAHAIVLSALDTCSSHRIYNVGQPNTDSEMEWIQFIGKVAGWQSRPIILPQAKLPAHLVEPLAFEQDLMVDTSLIRRDLHYAEYYSPNAAIKKTIDWLRENPIKTDQDRLDYEAEDKVFNMKEIQKIQ